MSLSFNLPPYRPPDFTIPPLSQAPVARYEPAPADGVLPDNFHATSNLPEYIQLAPGRWVLCPESRMDAAIILHGNEVRVVEPRDIKKGTPVIIGRMENGEEGIFVHADGFEAPAASEDKFQFNVRRTRESPFSRDYDLLYNLLRYEREHGGTITWVLGPAIAFDKDSRNAMVDLIKNGYCHALLAGNALATHDLEAAVFETGLGRDIYHQRRQRLGHYNHLDLLNQARHYTSLETAVRAMGIGNGIVAACVSEGVPIVLTGSIRDDGPLPDVIADAYEGQRQMRVYARRTTTAIAVATQLHAIAFGNMLPSYQVTETGVRPVYFYIVDVSEFATDKLANRGSMQATGITTNAQDFMVNLHRALVGNCTSAMQP